nr:uncharacterized mitochondrial protein AtMg00810-like [Tanacetum cinerariifolium]
RIFRYLKWTINLGLWYPKDSGFDLTAYSDADHTRCHLDRKTESEYVTVSSCCAQVLWMRTQLTDYGFFYDKVPIYCNSKSAIAISCNPVQHTRTKHIDVRTGIDLPRSLPSLLGKLGLVVISVEIRWMVSFAINVLVSFVGTVLMMVTIIHLNPSLNIQSEFDDHELFINKLIQQKLQNEYAQPFPAIAITFNLPTVEPKDSLRMRDEHLNTILETESNEFIKSSVKNHVPNPSESEDLSDSECDVLACDDFTTFSNLLFDADDDFSSSVDKSFSDENIPKEIYSNPLFDEEIISMKIDSHHFNVESDLIESLLNHDSSIISSSSKIDSLLDEFADDSMPPSIEDDNYDSERDILILEELLSNDSLSLPKNESFHFDTPSSPRPPAKPPDDDSGILTVKVVGDISEHYVSGPRLLPTQPTLVSNQEKSPHLISHRGLKAFQLSSKSPMMIYGGNTPILDIDSLFDEFVGKLTLLKSISPRIDETDCYHENEILLTNRLLYDNSSHRLPKEFVSENSNADIKSFSPSPIRVKDSDSLMEEIDLSFTSDDPMPPGIEEDDYDSERDILILEELLDNYSLSLPESESFHFDIPSFSHPLAKPPNGNTGILNIKMMGDISEQKVPIPRFMITLIPNQEKSLDLLPHQGLKIFQPSVECPMMIHGKNTPILDVPLFHFYPLDQYGGIGSSSAI